MKFPVVMDAVCLTTTLWRETTIMLEDLNEKYSINSTQFNFYYNAPPSKLSPCVPKRKDKNEIKNIQTTAFFPRNKIARKELKNIFLKERSLANPMNANSFTNKIPAT